MEGPAAAVKREPYGQAVPFLVPTAARELVGGEATDYSDAFVVISPRG
jgi:hypothetical protein